MFTLLYFTLHYFDGPFEEAQHAETCIPSTTKYIAPPHPPRTPALSTKSIPKPATQPRNRTETPPKTCSLHFPGRPAKQNKHAPNRGPTQRPSRTADPGTNPVLNASVHPPPTYEPSSANPRLFPLSLPRPNYHSSGLDAVHALKMLPITFRPAGPKARRRECDARALV